MTRNYVYSIVTMLLLVTIIASCTTQRSTLSVPTAQILEAPRINSTAPHQSENLFGPYHLSYYDLSKQLSCYRSSFSNANSVVISSQEEYVSHFNGSHSRGSCFDYPLPSIDFETSRLIGVKGPSFGCYAGFFPSMQYDELEERITLNILARGFPLCPSVMPPFNEDKWFLIFDTHSPITVEFSWLKELPSELSPKVLT